MSDLQVDILREEIIRDTAEFIDKLIDENVFKFSFGPEMTNRVPMILDCLLAHDKGAFDPLIITLFDSIETLLKLSIRWMPDRVIVGTGVVVYENTMESKRRARMWALMLHVNKFKTLLMGGQYVN